jgi:hypothetical protein
MSSDSYNKKNTNKEGKIEDYGKRILELYDDTSKNFWRTFGSLLLQVYFSYL